MKKLSKVKVHCMVVAVTMLMTAMSVTVFAQNGNGQGLRDGSCVFVTGVPCPNDEIGAGTGIGNGGTPNGGSDNGGGKGGGNGGGGQKLQDGSGNNPNCPFLP